MSQVPPTLGFIQNFGAFEWLVIAIIALLIFGRRLPEVGKSLGKGIVEFKKGLSGIEDTVQQPMHQAPPPANTWAQQNQPLPPGAYQPPAPPPQPVGTAPMQGQPNTVGRHDAPHA